MTKKSSYLIGVGGVSQSGKSTFATELVVALNRRQIKATIIEQDRNTLPENQLPKIRNRIDWDHPSTINWPHILNRIEELESEYDVVILEGIFAFANTDLNKLYDLTYYSDIDKETFISRRANETRWGKEPEWFYEHVWASHLQYGEVPGSAKCLGSNPKEYVAEAVEKIVELCRS